ncbi:MAG TPA: T9SS type A sorting domain-containing protein [Flavipsychrobacter sp.]|nr:T9SS type A sorting domain-containing protein [Flavipsychrobacter sp.]
MIRKFTLISLLGLSSLGASGQAVSVPISSGFNTDAIANGIGSPSTSISPGANLDAPTGTAYVFVAQDYQYNSTCALPAFFLPTGGLISNPLLYGPPTYQLAPYNQANCIVLSTTNTSDTLTFATPASAEVVYLLGSSGSAGANSVIDVVVTFTDNSTDTIKNVAVGDWYTATASVATTPIVVKASRVQPTITTCTIENNTNPSGPNLYQIPVFLKSTNYSKQISNVIVIRPATATGFQNVFAVGVGPACPAPISQGTSLSLTPISVTQIDGSFTPASSTPTGYVVVRYPASATPTAPANGTNYTAGGTLGAGTVIYKGTNTSFSATGLLGSTSYTFYIYSYDSAATCPGPVYNLVAPLTGTQSTIPCPTLAGNINVGTGGTYPTLTSAIGDYNTCPISGAVSFVLTDANYDVAETFPITIGANASASAFNTLTIKPAANNYPVISGAAPAIIKLNGADYVIIDGSNNGSTSRDLTIKNNQTTASSVIWLASMGGAGNGATHNTIKNTNIAAGVIATSNVFGIRSAPTGSMTGAGEDNDVNSVINCAISKCYQAISLPGSSATITNDTILIKNNEIGSNIATDYVTFRGIDVSNSKAVKIDSNTIFNIKISSTVSNAAIDIAGNVTNAEITNNNLYGIHSLNTGGYGAYGINFSATGTSDVLVANNLISDIQMHSYSTTTTTFNPFAIRIAAVINNIRIYNNTINMFGTVTGNTGASMSANVCITAAATNLDIRNNIFVNNLGRTTAANSFAYAYYLTSTPTFAYLDYNSYSGITGSTTTTYRVGYAASAARATLAAWKTYTAKDTNSVTGIVPFVSNTDMHIDVSLPEAWNVANRGIAIPTLPRDISGNIRSTTVGTPTDLGAYEFATPGIVPNDMEMYPATPVAGTPTVFNSAGKKIAEINWTGTVPTSISGKYYPGVPPPSQPSGWTYSNSYIDITASPSTGYNYTIKEYYTPAEINGIAESSLEMTKKDGTSPWTYVAGPNLTPSVDSGGRYIASGNLNSFSLFSFRYALLSIELIDFRGFVNGKENQLQWVTASETNNSGFGIERSADASEFESIGFVNSKSDKGNSSQRLQYNFNDKNPVNGDNYYRLKQVDRSGEVSYSNTILLKNSNKPATYVSAIYPNPTADNVYVSLVSEKSQTISYTILDIVGKVVRTGSFVVNSGNNTSSIGMGTLPSGNYTVKLMSEGFTETIRINRK